jgi:RHS repeat-associated protein
VPRYAKRRKGPEHYNYFRGYDASIGRYIESDPLGIRVGTNTFSYVYSAPLTFLDPMGLDVKVCFYPQAAAGFGHVGMGSPGDAHTKGFYPAGNALDGPGKVKPDEQSVMQCKILQAPPHQDDCVKKCQEERENDPGAYRLSSRQCTSFVRDCLARCKVFSSPYDGPRPFPFFQSLPTK